MEKNGLIFIDKQVGMTSRDVDFQIMKIFGTKKVGHLGTLDPFASGLLVVGVNEGTKLLSAFEESEKTYEAELILGKKTNTGDLTGEVVEEKDVPEIDDRLINVTLKTFLGKSTQTPPMYSAIKVNGRPLYSYARNNETVDVADREIEIRQIALLKYYKEEKKIHFFVTVSKGTYIRTLGEDIAEKLGTVGYLKNLRRLAVNNIAINNSFTSTLENPTIIPIIESAKIFCMPVLPSEESYHGQSILLNTLSNFVLIYNPTTNLPTAIYHYDKKIRKNNLYMYKVQRGFICE